MTHKSNIFMYLACNISIDQYLYICAGPGNWHAVGTCSTAWYQQVQQKKMIKIHGHLVGQVVYFYRDSPGAWWCSRAQFTLFCSIASAVIGGGVRGAISMNMLLCCIVQLAIWCRAHDEWPSKFSTQINGSRKDHRTLGLFVPLRLTKGADLLSEEFLMASRGR